VDNEHKLLSEKKGHSAFQLFNLEDDLKEAKDLALQQPDIAARLTKALREFNAEVDASVRGEDYPERAVNQNQPRRRMWNETPDYRPFFEQWKDRPEYRNWIKKAKFNAK
jgi:hypothetical protein